MAQKSFSDNITRTNLVVKVLRSREDNLPAGITKEMIEELNTLKEKAENLNAEQEHLKAMLKEKSAMIEQNITELEKKFSFIKRYIKLGVEKNLWGEFGFNDKK